MPVYLLPASGEALSSWLLRLCARMGVPPAILARNSFGIDTRAEAWWWRRPTAAQLERISERTGIAADTLAELTFKGWAGARNDEIDERFAPHRFNRNNIYPGGVRPVAVCPACLAEDETPYIRKEWMIGWTSMCPRHRVVLATQCQTCDAKLRLPGLASSVIPRIGFCHHCGVSLAGHASERARTAPLLMQEKLLVIKATNCGKLPGMGVLDWQTIIAAIDLVLGVVWVKGAGRLRERLFEAIACDLELGCEARLDIDWTSNYGTTVLLAWLFGHWPERLRKLWVTMEAPAIDAAVDRIAPIAAKSLQHLRCLCASVKSETIDRRKTAIDWLMALPETSDDLRRRAQKAYHSGLRRKLMVLAVLRNGTDLCAAATSAKLSPDIVLAWLETGMEYGLEAVIGKPLRGRDLSEDQEREIGAWLATIRGRTRGLGAWSAGHIQHEILGRFGILINAATAHRMLHVHAPYRSAASPEHSFTRQFTK